MPEIVIPYSPRKPQRDFHVNRKRWSLIVAHRRMGKTVGMINELVKEAINNRKDRPRYAYIAPTYKQAKVVAFDYLKHYTSVIPGVKVNESELRVDLPNGSRISLYGADNTGGGDSLRGIYLDGCVIDEPAQINPTMFSRVIRPALSDRNGWCAFIGTFDGQNSFWQLYEQVKDDPEWYVKVHRASETGILPQEELDAARKVMTEEDYLQEYEAVPTSAVRGAYYANELAQIDKDGRITDVPYDPALRVHTAWDVGVDDSTAIWWWQETKEGRVRVIDYYESNGTGVSSYVKLVQSKAYLYGKHFAPHDARNRDKGSGRSPVDIAKDLGLVFEVLPQSGVQSGIENVRLTLPRCAFDIDRCNQGLDALRNYRADYDERKQVYRNHPRHDWASHGADAFRYLAMALPNTKPAPKISLESMGVRVSVGWMG